MTRSTIPHQVKPSVDDVQAPVALPLQGERFSSSLKIGAKQRLAFGLLIVLTVVPGLVILAALTRVRNAALEQLLVANEALFIAQQIQKETLEARRQERDFFLSYPTEGFHAAYFGPAIANQRHLQTVRNLAFAAKKLEEAADAPNRSNIQDLVAIQEATITYHRAFNKVVGNVAVRGFKNTGKEGRFRRAAQALENSTAFQNSPQLQILLLQLRRHEKNWLLRAEAADVEAVERLGEQLKAQIPVYAADAETQTVLQDLIETYLTAFTGLANLDLRLGDDTEEFQAVAQSIPPLVDRITARNQTTVNEIVAELQQVESKLQLLGLALLAVVVCLGIGLAIAITRNIVGPVVRLADVAEQIAAGDLSRQAQVETGDEIGRLAASFNYMTAQFRALVDTLEQHVADRTERLEIVAALGEQLSAVLDLDELLSEVVNQIKEKFGYYHAHIYLLDEAQERLVVVEGTGAAGVEMKANGHAIPLNMPTSLVSRAARSGSVVRVDNVREEPDWLPNALLPDTRSEMAVPIMLEGQVVGVLDVQQDELAGLDESDATLLRSVANQVAIAIRNARLFERTDRALKEAQAIQERYTEQSWEKVKLQKQGGQYHFRHVSAPDIDEIRLAEARRLALVQNGPSFVSINEAHESSAAAAIVAPVKLRHLNIGTLQIHPTDDDHAWTEDDIAIVEAVVDQLAQAAENLRLFNDTRERASREQLIGQIADELRRAPDMETLMEIGVSELARVLRPGRAFVRFGSAQELTGTADRDDHDRTEAENLIEGKASQP